MACAGNRLTKTEREEWRNLIYSAFQRKIDALYENKPNFDEEFDKRVEEEADKKLKIGPLLTERNKLQEELEKLEEEYNASKEALDEKLKKTEVKALATAKGITIREAERQHRNDWHRNNSLENARLDARRVARKDLEHSDPVCKARREINADRESALQALVVANSPHEMKFLWQGIQKLLNGEKVDLATEVINAALPSPEPVKDLPKTEKKK